MAGESPGLTVSRIALGCGNFGGVGSAPEFFGRGLTEDEAFALMDAAWAAGIDWFDTADAYGGGRSERAIGRWMAARGVRPRLTTKTYNPVEAGADHGLKPDRIARQLRSSLDRLGVGHVELYLAHDYDPDVPLEDTIGAFEHARAAVRRLLQGDRSGVRSMNGAAGTLTLFRGHFSPHRVTTVTGPRPRVIAVLSYASTPDARLSSHVKQLFHGRTS